MSIIKYRACMQIGAALLASLILAACSGGDGDQGPQSDFSNLRVHKSDSPYRDVLVDCVTADTTQSSCSFDMLPLLGMDSLTPSKTDILNRLVISHSWMGVRFEQILNQLPEQMLPIFSSATAIVIDDDIRPSYYTNLTGAIYLDPANIWLEPSEARTINRKEDFRAGFSDPLIFRALSRTIKNGERATRFSNLSDPVARSMDDIMPRIASLLLHELAHAHDFFPADEYDNLVTSQKPLFQSKENTTVGISSGLTNDIPLTSQTLLDLGSVMYLGASANASQREISATDVGEEFETDGATTAYAYSTRFEDTATLFEEAMMKYFFDIQSDIAFTTAPTGENARFCNFYEIKWGVRNRIGDIRVKDRAQYVVEKILPNLENMDLFFQDLPAPQNLDLNGNWCSTTLESEQALSGSESKPAPLSPLNIDELRARH